ncbi:hypothetical protein [Pseudoxanthomonas winnipegensis]|uniref:hypothetical protein n=1 Tax=Pseudoxanthomonas winnipegensis TaxID=2480810 RepID=UPI003F87E24A
MKRFAAAIFVSVLIFGCTRATVSNLPDGYKVWAMNSEEIYVSDSSNELLVGPHLRQVGVTKHYIVTTSEAAGPNYVGNLHTSGYSLIERPTRRVETGLTESQAKERLFKVGESMPLLSDFNQYQLVTR